MPKKKVGKMAIFGRNAWVNPFVKISIFRLFALLVFIGRKGVLSFYNIVKQIFVACIFKKKKMEKCPFFGQNHGLTLEKNLKFGVFEPLIFKA